MSKLTGLFDSEGNTMRFVVGGRDVSWLLRNAADRHPDKPFLVWEPLSTAGAMWTYAEFEHDVAVLASGLAGRGVTIGDRVLIHLKNCPEYLLTWFACAQLGAISVSTNTRSTARELSYFADHAGVVAAVTSPQFAKLVAENAPRLNLLVVTDNDAGEQAVVLSSVQHVPFAQVLSEGAKHPASEEMVGPWADLGIQYTSGTTSQPKGVLWTHANAVWAAQVNSMSMHLKGDDVTLIILPLYHTNALSYSLLSSLWLGTTVVLEPGFSASSFWEVSLRNRVTWCSMVPFCVNALLRQQIPSRHCYRFWAPATRMAKAEDVTGIPTFGWWGMTETVCPVIVGNIEHPGPNGSIGRASPAYEIDIRSLDGRDVRPGERGRLFIRGTRGVSLFKEYYREAEATATAFDHEGWFDTGDIISVEPGGDLRFSDRGKDMLKVGGENVAPSEIEAFIIQTQMVKEVAVVGQFDDMFGEVPVAFVIAQPGAPADLPDRIINACMVGLSDFKVPRAVHIVEVLPRSELAKVSKDILRKQLSGSSVKTIANGKNGAKY